MLKRNGCKTESDKRTLRMRAVMATFVPLKQTLYKMYKKTNSLFPSFLHTNGSIFTKCTFEANMINPLADGQMKHKCCTLFTFATNSPNANETGSPTMAWKLHTHTSDV